MNNDVQTNYLIDAEPYVEKVNTNESIPTYYVKKLLKRYMVPSVTLRVIIGSSP